MDVDSGLTTADIAAGWLRLGLGGSNAVLHTSLRSFGRVLGGAEAVVDALAATFQIALVPAFTFESTVPPPEDDRPARNGWDYSSAAGLRLPARPFRIESAGIDPKMGAVPRAFVARPGVARSDHPWHSWAGLGADVEHLLAPHPWETTNLPLERLACGDAWVVLAGVGLTSCTAIHVAEERAGRPPFIRWALDRAGVVRRVRASGCSKGFDALEPYCGGLFRESRIGASRVRVAPLGSLIECCAEVIRHSPEITVCSEACVRCRDAARGGPLEAAAAS